MVLGRMTHETDLIAQSMGGLVALKAALLAPDKVRRMVLAGTSGGVPVEDFGAAEWRIKYREQFPTALPWITEIREDLTASLSTLGAPTLLLCGDKDSISPVSVGERLLELLPNASLRIIKGGDHDFPETHSAEVAQLVQEHLGGG
jgi:pimeloyl-ACP methyl ester carboxylesterase